MKRTLRFLFLAVAVFRPELARAAETTVFLRGDVEIRLQGGCSGCSGGSMEVSATVDGDLISVRGDSRCSGQCEAYWNTAGSTVVRGLAARTWLVRTPDGTRVEIRPLSLSASERSEWLAKRVEESCAAGVHEIDSGGVASPRLFAAIRSCAKTADLDTMYGVVLAMAMFPAEFLPDLRVLFRSDPRIQIRSAAAQALADVLPPKQWPAFEKELAASRKSPPPGDQFGYWESTVDMTLQRLATRKGPSGK